MPIIYFPPVELDPFADDPEWELRQLQAMESRYRAARSELARLVKRNRGASAKDLAKLYRTLTGLSLYLGPRPHDPTWEECETHDPDDDPGEPRDNL